MVEAIYNQMLGAFSDTLKQTSEDVNKSGTDKYMTSCEVPVVNVDRFKDDFVKDMELASVPKSCDALFKSPEGGYFLIEFKNGVINPLKKYEIKIKIFESLLLLSERFSQTTDFTRNNVIFILVYNKEAQNTSLSSLKEDLFVLAQDRKIHFGLNHFRKLYFKDVFTYSKSEFESEFVAKYGLAR